MFSRIVVPLDGSDLAAAALPQAIDLAHAAGAPLHLIQVLDFNQPIELASYPLGDGYVDFVGFQQAVETERTTAGAYLQALRDDLSARGVQVTAQLIQGNPAKEIVAATVPGDVVVMTTHGRGGFARWFLGSVAEGVVRRAEVPVLLVRVSEVETRPRRSLEPAASMLQ